MDWYIFCPIRGLVNSFPDDSKGQAKAIKAARELGEDIKTEGYKIEEIIIIRGEAKRLLPPGDWQLVDRKG